MIRHLFSGLFVASAIGIGFMAIAAQPAMAQGLDGLHDQRAEGGRWCMSNHPHAGAGSGPTRQAAERDAAANYSSFTAWEYGNSWGSWSLAAGKAANCVQSGTSWSCNIEARPCRPISGGGGTARRARAKRS